MPSPRARATWSAMSSRVCPGSVRQSQITSANGGTTFGGSWVRSPVGVTVIRVRAGSS